MELFSEHRQRKADHARTLWTLLVLVEWLDWVETETVCQPKDELHKNLPAAPLRVAEIGRHHEADNSRLPESQSIGRSQAPDRKAVGARFVRYVQPKTIILQRD